MTGRSRLRGCTEGKTVKVTKLTNGGMEFVRSLSRGNPAEEFIAYLRVFRILRCRADLCHDFDPPYCQRLVQEHEGFSRLVAALIRWNLIREESNPENEQEKLYSITPDGELALFVYSARMKKRGVAATPGLS